jgi:fructosamine-3-kinase
LLHGDLWSGNFMCDTNAQPVLIDPAVYYGHPAVDQGMSTLFGGFAPAFYDAYLFHAPQPAHYRQQWEVCNLYPLLIHLYLFRTGYLPQIENILQKFSARVTRK